MAKTLMVFDFDDTIVENSVEYSAMCVAPYELVNKLLADSNCSSKPWAETADFVMGELHKAGLDKEAIMERVLAMEAFNGMVEFLKKTRSRRDLELMVLSGANTLMVDAYLSHVGLKDAFTRIIANNAHFDDNGRMHVSCYHVHQCPNCLGLCKGTILREILREGSYQRVVYVGDGSNDVCPSTCLSEGDHVVARELFPLATRLSKLANNGRPIRATVHTADFKSDQVERLLSSLVSQ